MGTIDCLLPTVKWQVADYARTYLNAGYLASPWFREEFGLIAGD